MENPGHAVPLVPLTRVEGRDVLINLARVESFEEGENSTKVILLRGNYYDVRETMDEITERVYDATDSSRWGTKR